MRTLIDTTSLIALAMYDFGKAPPHDYRFDSSRHKDAYLSNVLTPGMEALILYDDVLVDCLSFDRNQEKYPALSGLKEICSFTNQSVNQESECYSLAASVLTPLLERPGEWLVDALRRHIQPLDTVELSLHDRRFAPSTYWKHISGRLSKSEGELVVALERVLGRATPFSGAAMTSLVRLFYYLVTQEIEQCSISINPTKGEFLTGLHGWRHDDNRIPRTILDAFDADLKKEYLERQVRWLGGTDLTFTPPILYEFAMERAKREGGLIPALLNIRNSVEARDYRSGVNQLATCVANAEGASIKAILAELEKMRYLWQTKGKPKTGGSQIILSIPFVQGLGSKIAGLFPKRTASSSSEKIFTFLNRLTSCSG
jgi:hypothetical protein